MLVIGISPKLLNKAILMDEFEDMLWEYLEADPEWWEVHLLANECQN